MPAALTRPVRIGTDCSGMETPVMALAKMGVPYEHMFSCDIDKNVKKQILHNFPPKVWFDDLMERKNELRSTPAVDLYIAGFPCQPFSAAGLQKGFKDDRGMVFFGCARYIDAKRPRAFILENVKRLLNHAGGKTFKKVMQTLRSIAGEAYNVTYQLIDTQDHGVPQSRPRVYIVGIRRDCQRGGEFEFPEKLPRVSIESALDPVKRKPTMKDLPPASNTTSYSAVTQTLKQLDKKGATPLKKTFVLDCDASARFRTLMHDRAMCMTKSRCSGFWLTSRGRRMNLNEMLRCQGMTRCFKQVVPDRALGAQIGNAMSQNVIERLLIKLLPAAGLVQPDLRLVDRWASRVKRLTPSKADEGTPLGRKRTSSSSSEPASSAKRARTA